MQGLEVWVDESTLQPVNVKLELGESATAADVVRVVVKSVLGIFRLMPNLPRCLA